MSTFGFWGKSIFDKAYLHIGYNLKGFRLGFGIDRWSINLDLGFVWLELEW